MQFEGLNDATLANAPALNRGFIELAASKSAPAGVPEDLAERLAALTGQQRERLARAPFLLFTLDSYDLDGWRRAAQSAPRPDLFRQAPSDAESRLAVATLGVVWALARSNRYAARYLAGAGVAWCDHVANRPLPELIASLEGFETLVVVRFAGQPGFWRRLIAASGDARQFVRRAARLSALQRALTFPADEVYAPVKNAACRRRDTSLKVAETPSGRRRRD